MHQKQPSLSGRSKEYHVTSNRIGASAGTGKTYQLASRYIALLVLGVRPEEIIALTFTRKAAGEFRNRILHALAEGADNKCDKKTGRNELTVRVWETLSGLRVEPAEYGAWKAVDASNPVPLLPVTAALVREAADMKQYPEQLYHESPALQHYYQFREPNAERFAELLQEMVAVLNKLRLSTIDSFFSSLVTTNSLELGMNQVSPLDPAEESNVRTAAIRLYLDAQSVSDQSRSDFLTMFSGITGGVGNRTLPRIESDLQAFLRLYRELPPQAQWGSIATFPHDEKVHIATAEEQETYTGSVAELNQLLDEHGNSVLEPQVYSQLRDLANGETYIKRDAAKVVNHYANLPLLEPVLQTLLNAFYQDAELNDELNQAISLWEQKGANHLLYSDIKTAVANIIKKLRKENKRSFTAKQLEGIGALKSATLALAQVSDAQRSILARIAQMAETLVKLVIPCKLRAAALRSKNLYKLLAGYASIYDARMKADGRLSFDDISRMAQELMLKDPGNNRHHIAYRMGGWLSHWMLDEFQDTSESQFRTLTPLLQPIVEDAGSNAIDFTEEQWTARMPDCLRENLNKEEYCVAGESLFIVGDTKQSIYGFRTGKTEVFERIAADEPWKKPLRPSPLSCSFRSSPDIMKFTNELFKALGEVEKQQENTKDGIEKLPVTFSEDFTKHQSAKDFPGYVEMNFIAPPGEDEDEASQKELIYDKVVEVLRTLTDNDSTLKNGMSIAILVRSNDNADEIQKHLLSKMPDLHTLLVKDSLAAAACPMGEILLYFFKWLLHPGDLAALNVIRASFLSGLTGKDPALSHALLLKELQDCGFIGMMKKLLSKMPAEDARENKLIIERWKNEAVVFDTKGSTLAEWVHHMKNLSMQAAGASGAVQIMTMHKSKGLEFDAVILPYTSS
ncbi:MAG: UvrD-helicase domain-containing protein, partial [Akkermansia sp.]|nr:UvrD-helicase domain-containing protein [Akkermansia sp.]